MSSIGGGGTKNTAAEIRNAVWADDQEHDDTDLKPSNSEISRAVWADGLPNTKIPEHGWDSFAEGGMSMPGDYSRRYNSLGRDYFGEVGWATFGHEGNQGDVIGIAGQSLLRNNTSYEQTWEMSFLAAPMVNTPTNARMRLGYFVTPGSADYAYPVFDLQDELVGVGDTTASMPSLESRVIHLFRFKSDFGRGTTTFEIYGNGINWSETINQVAPNKRPDSYTYWSNYSNGGDGDEWMAVQACKPSRPTGLRGPTP